MDRLISEKQIIDTIKTWAIPLQVSNTESIQDFWVEDLCKLIRAIPSAEPKTGYWIFQKIKYGEHLAPMRMWCSNCNSAFDLCCNQIKRYDEATKKEYLWGHCPWCGAKMVDPQERSEE